MTIYLLKQGRERIHLTRSLASSGEGSVWLTDRPGLVAKVYHAPTADRIAKLRVMIANPPEGAFSKTGDIDYAWPRQVLLDGAEMPVGFVMAHIEDAFELTSVYNPAARRRRNLAVNWKFLMAACLNLTIVIRKVHEKGYVLGDIKSQNIFINNRARVTVIDTDSFQVKDASSGQIFRCLVGSEGFTPPELIGKDLSTVDQLEVHDRFRLGVLIHLMLFGSHPFQGRWAGSGDPPALDDLVLRGYWPYANGSFIQPGPNTIPLDILYPELKSCFLRCFNEGHGTPEHRPSASDWMKALNSANSSMKICSSKPHHWFDINYGNCPWCERMRTHGVDQFASAIDSHWIVIATPEKSIKNIPDIALISSVGSARMAPDDHGDSCVHHDYVKVVNGVSSTFVWIPVFGAYQLIVPSRCGNSYSLLPEGHWVKSAPNSGIKGVDWCYEEFGGFYAGKFTASRADSVPGDTASGIGAKDGSNSMLKVAQFCVPWTNVSRDSAIEACKAYDSACSLMNDHEWTSLAVWSMINGLTVYGNNSRGQDADDRFISFLHDPTCSGRALTGTGTRPDWSNGLNLTTHTGMTNGVYDLNGNVSEWTATIGGNSESNRYLVDGSRTGASMPGSGFISTLSTHPQVRRYGVPGKSGIVGKLLYNNDYFIVGSRITTAALRGGHWNGGTIAGIWSLNLFYARSDSSLDIGFRPVLRF